uniref:Uncharacterized protein n=1 Tax=Romanomermis culicivorax TaxID=13658 RepID=A0A915IVU3_ROMCU
MATELNTLRITNADEFIHAYSSCESCVRVEWRRPINIFRVYFRPIKRSVDSTHLISVTPIIPTALGWDAPGWFMPLIITENCCAGLRYSARLAQAGSAEILSADFAPDHANFENFGVVFEGGKNFGDVLKRGKALFFDKFCPTNSAKYFLIFSEYSTDIHLHRPIFVTF